jgi:hypothetical protein
MLMNKTLLPNLSPIVFCNSILRKKAPLKKAAPLTFNHSFTADHYKMQQLKDKLRA